MHEHDEPLGALNRELDVTPSPAFAARIRARVQGERSSTVLRRWTFAAVGVAVAAAVWLGVRPSAPEVETPPAPNVAAVTPVNPPMVEEEPEAAVVPAVRQAAASPAPRVRRAVRPASQTADLLRAVLVPPDQMAGLQQLRAALLDGRLTASDLPPDRTEWDAELVPNRPPDSTAPADDPFDRLMQPDGPRYSE
jgi:hypothetical protein